MEIVNRELDGVLYLAMHLAKRGMPVLFGERMVHEYIFRLYKGQPVIYFDQDQSIDVNRAVIDSGGYVVNLNAEGQNLDSNPEVVALFAKVASTFNYMFVRGERQRDAIVKAFPENKKKVVLATGHPAFDLLQSKFHTYHEKSDIIDEHGEDYILINTQFATFNHKMGLSNYLRMVSKLKEWKDLYTDEDYLETLRQQGVQEEKVAKEFVKLARALAKAFPDRHVIIRPHPTEGIDFYKNNLSGLPNMFVKHSGPVMPWLTSAGAVVHYSCTTGVEALIMDKLVVRYDPFNTGGERLMQSAVGMKAVTADEVVQLINSGSMSSSVRNEQIEIIRPHATNCDTSAASAIADLVRELSESGETWIPEKLDLWEAAKCWRKHVSKLIRMHQPGRNGRKVRYALEKFPRLPFFEVMERVSKIRACEPDLPEVRLEQLGLNVFLMRPAQG